MIKIKTCIRYIFPNNKFIDHKHNFYMNTTKEEFIKSINDKFNTNFPLSAKILNFPRGEDMFSMKLDVLTEDTMEDLFEHMEDMGVVYD